MTLALACGPTAPLHPTYLADVQPILQANCSRCHGERPLEPQIAFFRLDRLVAQDLRTFDALQMRGDILTQAVELRAPQMPPTFPLSDRQRETLRRWAEDGAPKGTRDNHPPEAELLGAAPSSADQTLRVQLRAHDGDADGLWVRIFVGDVPLSPRLRQGISSATLDTGRIPDGTYPVTAHLDDGFSDAPADNDVVVPLIDAVAVSHGAKGTAPTVRLLEPNGRATQFGAPIVSWEATDPDPGDALTVRLDLYQLDANRLPVLVGPIATGLPNSPKSFVWSPAVPALDPLGAPNRYLIRVTATDVAGNVRFDDSDAPFTLGAPFVPTALTWADVKPVFDTFCNSCHGEPARYAPLEGLRFDKHSVDGPALPADDDLGVYERRGAILQRVVYDASEPPVLGVKPGLAELQAIETWIRGGAPLTAAPPDGRPLVSFSVPNDAQVSRTDAAGQVVLDFRAVDPEGLPLVGGLEVRELSPTSDDAALCEPSSPDWVPVAGSDINAGSLLWAAPHPGLFCFRAIVTDAAGQTEKRAASFPVRFTLP